VFPVKYEQGSYIPEDAIHQTSLLRITVYHPLPKLGSNLSLDQNLFLSDLQTGILYALRFPLLSRVPRVPVVSSSVGPLTRGSC
jgi:hypothetical protein